MLYTISVAIPKLNSKHCLSAIWPGWTDNDVSTAKSMRSVTASSFISHSLDIFHHNWSYSRRELLTECISRNEYSMRRARFQLTALIIRARTPISSVDTTSVATLNQETPP